LSNGLPLCGLRDLCHHSLHGHAATVRLGILNDSAADAASATTDLTGWLRREIDSVRASGRLNTDVEIVQKYGLGLPEGSFAAVERAFDALVAEDVVLIVGPAIGDNALLATPLAERTRMPMINWSGAERARGDYMFHLQVGSHEDESLLIARHLAAIGAKRAAVVHDLSPIGDRHLEYLAIEGTIAGLEIVAAVGIDPLASEAGDAVRQALEASPQAFVYFGLGLSAPAVAQALAKSGWAGPRIMNAAGMRGHDPAFAAKIEGWIYPDLYSDHNRTLAAIREPAAPAFRSAVGHDIARLVAEGLARAPQFTREGVRLGLEQVKWLPAAEGKDGTLLGFGVYDRGALHGHYLVLRQWRQGCSEEI
jgi:branched-chain amino acid transport system substrate-binding protein